MIVLNRLLLVLMLFSSSSLYATDLGQTIYEKSCQTCHNPSTAPLMLAPTVHNITDWTIRFEIAAKIAKENPSQYPDALAVLVASVKNGKGSMIPGGMCQDDAAPNKKCTNADYAAAIKFMSTK